MAQKDRSKKLARKPVAARKKADRKRPARTAAPKRAASAAAKPRKLAVRAASKQKKVKAGPARKSPTKTAVRRAGGAAPSAATRTPAKKPAKTAALAAPASARREHPAQPRVIARPAGRPQLKPAAGPVAAPAAPASPKDIAEKTAAARQMAAVQKKPVSQRHGFKTNEFVVYPAHGVGRIVGIEEQEIAGISLELFVINFDKEKLTLRVPTGKLQSVGMRKLAEEETVRRAMDILKGRARVKRTMWSRRAAEYITKINSGDLIAIAEVVRDLYRSEAQPEQSYSERQLYEDALDRMAREIAAVEKLDERGAVQRITEVLSRSARGRRAAAEGGESASEETTTAA